MQSFTSSLFRIVIFSAALAASVVSVSAQKPARGPLQIPGGKSHEPVNISADKLEYFDKEQKAVYNGNVVVTQGEATMKCTVLTIFLTKQEKNAETDKEATPIAGNSDVSRMEATGPVTIVQKDQTGSGDAGVYERAANKVTLTGHAKLQQGPNLTTGERITYTIDQGRAVVEGNVRSFLLPGSTPADAGEPQKKKPKP